MKKTDNPTKIDLLRAERGLTRKALSEKSGVPLRTLEGWSWRKNLTRDAYQLQKVARVLGCSIEDIIEPETEKDETSHDSD